MDTTNRPFSGGLAAAVTGCGIPRMRLCRVSRVAASTLSDFLSGRRSPSLRTVDKLTPHLGLYLTSLDGPRPVPSSGNPYDHCCLRASLFDHVAACPFTPEQVAVASGAGRTAMARFRRGRPTDMSFADKVSTALRLTLRYSVRWPSSLTEAAAAMTKRLSEAAARSNLPFDPYPVVLACLSQLRTTGHLTFTKRGRPATAVVV